MCSNTNIRMEEDMEDNTNINSNYKYDDNDVNEILDKRLQEENLREYSGVFRIAPTGETECKLVELLKEETRVHENFPNRTLLIPYLTRHHQDGHWVGIVVRFENNSVINAEYYNSLEGSHNTSTLEENLKIAYNVESFKAINKEPANVIIQKDYASCGPCMIENLINAAKSQGCSTEKNSNNIRKNHIVFNG